MPAYIHFGSSRAGVIFDDGLLDITVVSPVSRDRVLSSLTVNQVRVRPTRSGMTSVIYAPDDLLYRSNHRKWCLMEIIGTTPIDVECAYGGQIIEWHRNKRLEKAPRADMTESKPWRPNILPLLCRIEPIFSSKVPGQLNAAI